MEREVFRYRNGTLIFVTAFLYVWSIGWLFGVMSAGRSGKVTINEQPATLEQARLFLIFAALLGVAIFALATGLALMLAFARIEITDCVVLKFDWLGRKRFEARLSEFAPLVETTGQNGYRVAKVQAGPRELKFSSSINDYAMLKQALNPVETRAPATNHAPLQALIRSTRTFRYLGSYLHVFSFIWIGGIVYMALPLTTSSAIHASTNSDSFVSKLGLILFLLVGVWMQLTGWVERISLGPEGIKWIDWLGRVRVEARLDEIVDVEETSGNRVGSGKIATLKGTVQFSSYLWGSSQLLKVAREIVDSRKAAKSAEPST